MLTLLLLRTYTSTFDMIVPLLTTAAGLAGQAFGLAQSANANKKAESYLQSRMNSLSSKFTTDYYQDFLDTEGARSTMNRLNTQFKDMAQNIKGSAASGSTAEAEIAAKDNIQQRYADAVSNLAGMGTQRKDALLARYQGNMGNLENQKMGILQQKAANWSTFGGNVGQASEGVLKAWGMGAFDKTGG
jgi:DNA-binding helix-hairpin-helix protein with protein kinase domain